MREPFRWGVHVCVGCRLGSLLSTRVTLFIIIVQGEDLQQEQDGPAAELQPEDGVFVGSDADDGFEPTGALHEETEDRYHVEETETQAPPAEEHQEVPPGGDGFTRVCPSRTVTQTSPVDQ
ncbi:hypothetical protein CB1_000844035 [Camelus ferus]|nr:hypothetical protein CB1_000844035 [Camelus ferus]